ncbi:hypothetical protein [Nocardioides sp. B-3]|uniref:hypothetical protein n=1 Tax=Nocardioides sp. B-3 TaxID=2895565 RepID=UPI00215340B5|nr:hypothetical protein [Nocardioides sp. B-3]UUZ58003.1 hypothetical protein LP418_16940 [Nocardioides sp. B-3]
MDANQTSQPDEAELDRRRALRDRRTHDPVELMERRRELAGVNPWADQVIEGVARTA